MILFPSILNYGTYWFAMNKEQLMPPMAMLEPLTKPVCV
jgi:hypothetical protein